jgi:hypothetical protein
MDKSDLELLAQYLPEKGIKDIVIIGSQFDGEFKGEKDKSKDGEAAVLQPKGNDNSADAHGFTASEKAGKGKSDNSGAQNGKTKGQGNKKDSGKKYTQSSDESHTNDKERNESKKIHNKNR